MSKEQLPVESLDPRGLSSWCIHQRWVYQNYHGTTVVSSTNTNTTTTKTTTTRTGRTSSSSLPSNPAETLSHLSLDRIEKLEALGFEWDQAMDPSHHQSNMVVQRQTLTPTQLAQWKREFQQYQRYLVVKDDAADKKSSQKSSSKKRKLRDSDTDDEDDDEKENSSNDDDSQDSDDDEFSIQEQEEAQEWLQGQIARYREWDAGFVEFPQEQREALNALQLLPELTEQSPYYRYHLLNPPHDSVPAATTTDIPNEMTHDSDKDKEHDNEETENSETEHEQESDEDDDDDNIDDDDDDDDEDDSSDDDQDGSTRRKHGKSSRTSSNGKAQRPLLADELWHKHWQELIEFQKKHGHTQVTRSMDLQLGRWVTKERAKYRKKKHAYPLDRKKKLDAMGFCWEPNIVNKKPKVKPTTPTRVSVIDWEVRLAQMKAFHEKYGHVHVTNTLDAKLSSWVKKERIRYRQDREAYPSDRKKCLEELGFCWEPIIAIKNQEREPYAGTMAAEKDAIWWKRFHELKDFKERFGHVRVPSRWNENRELSNWYRHTKERYRGFLEGKNKFPKNRHKALEELDFHRLSQAVRDPSKRTRTRMRTRNASQNTETPEAQEVPTKSEEESNKDNEATAIAASDATDSVTSQPRMTGDPAQPASLDPISIESTEVLMKNAETVSKEDGTSQDATGSTDSVGDEPVEPTKKENDAMEVLVETDGASKDANGTTDTADEQPGEPSQANKADETNDSELLRPRRAVLWTSSRKRIRLPMQHEAKRPKSKGSGS
jgi:hypothetical protein